MTHTKISNLLFAGWRDLCAPSKEQIPGLNALRTAAISLVVATHVALFFRPLGNGTRFVFLPFVRGGWSGVLLFYVLSGFLIGGQLWKELAKTGTIRIGQFLFRRGMRIWPLYFVVLVMLMVLRYGRYVAGDVWPCFVFLSNYYPSRLYLGSWSLATEEQFYILMPLLLLGLFKLTKNPTKLLTAVGGLLCVSSIMRVLALRHRPVEEGMSWVILNVYHPLHTNFDCLIMGVLLAGISFYLDKMPKVVRKPSIFVVPVAALVAWGLAHLDSLIFSYLGLSVIFGSLLWYAVHGRQGPIHRLAEHRIFYVMAKLSYGVYLIHEPVAKLAARYFTIFFPLLHGGLQFYWVSFITLSVSLLSASVFFLVVEYPFLYLRDHVFVSGGPPHALPDEVRRAS